MQKDLPKVSFIIPVKNEEKKIGICLESLLDLDYPKEKIEIILSEGNSVDRTRMIIDCYAKKHGNIKIVDSIENKSQSRNVCIKKSTGEFLMNFSGHTIAERNLLKVLISKFTTNDIAGVGCPNLTPPDQNHIGDAIGVLSTGFMAGGGTNTFTQNATFDKDRFVDHVPFICYRREIFDKIGYFDKDIEDGEDAELDIRIKKSGYKILYTPETKVYLYKPDSLKNLFKKMYLYGIARSKIIKKHPDQKNLFYTISPIVFVIAPFSLLLFYMLFLYDGYLYLLITSLILYIIACIISAIIVSKSIKNILLSLVIYPLIHVGYSAGILKGMGE